MARNYGEELTNAFSLLESADKARKEGRYKEAFHKYGQGLPTCEYALTVLAQTDINHGFTDAEIGKIFEVSRLHSINYISVCIKLQRYFDAIQWLEFIKSRYLGSIVARRRINGLPSTIPKDHLPKDLLVMPGIGKDHILYCLSGLLKAAFALIFVDTDDIHILTITSNDKKTLTVNCFKLLQGYKTVIDPLFPEFVETLLSPGPEMDKQIQPLLAKLSPGFREVVRELKANNVKKLILVPHLGTHLIPFHLIDVGIQGGAKLAWDCFEEFVYAPSINMFMWSFSGVDTYLPGTSFIIEYATLNFPHFALHTALQLPGPLVLHIDPKPDQFDIAPHTGILHFDCHGKVEEWNFVDSSLLIGDFKITFQDIVEHWNLSGTWLVVLSACETGMNINLENLGDEYYGMDGAFLAAGAMSVISSFCTINEISTLLILSKYYTYLFSKSEHMSPASALKKACLWLRSGAWKRELNDLMKFKIKNDRKDKVPLGLIRQIERSMRVMQKLLSDLPASYFSSCYYWGALKCSGYGSRDIPADSCLVLQQGADGPTLKVLRRQQQY